MKSPALVNMGWRFYYRDERRFEIWPGEVPARGYVAKRGVQTGGRESSVLSPGR